jgi:hypothetical protein
MKLLSPPALTRPLVQPPAWAPPPPARSPPPSTARVGGFYVDHELVSWRTFLSRLKEIRIIKEGINSSLYKTNPTDLSSSLILLRKLCKKKHTVEGISFQFDLIIRSWNSLNGDFSGLRLEPRLTIFRPDNPSTIYGLYPSEGPPLRSFSKLTEVNNVIYSLLHYFCEKTDKSPTGSNTTH